MSQREIITAQLRDVFKADEKCQLNAKLARLCVLYEDLRVELCGIVELSIPALDVLDDGKYRRLYFVRRSIGTIREFADALLLINDDPNFQLNEMKEDEATWDSAITFFQENKHLLGAIRNDIGGHFGHPAALHALDRLPDVSCTIELVGELVDGRDRTDFRLRFAGEIVTSALRTHLQSDDIEGYKTLLRDCIKPAYKHAARCVQTLLGEFFHSCRWKLEK
jgi:hypothetical protein